MRAVDADGEEASEDGRVRGGGMHDPGRRSRGKGGHRGRNSSGEEAGPRRKGTSVGSYFESKAKAQWRGRAAGAKRRHARSSNVEPRAVRPASQGCERTDPSKAELRPLVTEREDTGAKDARGASGTAQVQAKHGKPCEDQIEC